MTPVECGKCIRCRIKRREEWTARLMLELSTTVQDAWFVTLTYAPEHLPQGGTLVKRDVQLFMKKLRARLAPTRIRFFLCGEYGSKTGRPHYHAVLFGLPKERLDQIDASWNLGFTSVSELTPERARYTARYTTKKLIGSDSYPDGRSPEFSIMSKHPALGRDALLRIGRVLQTHSGSARLPNTVRFGGKSYLLDRHIRASVEKELNNGEKVPQSPEERARSAAWLSKWWPTWRQFHPHRDEVEAAEKRRNRARLARSEQV